MGVLFTNNASTTLSAAISSTSATSISVASSSTFPAPGAGEYFYATIDDTSNIEIVKVTAVSGTTWTVVRGADNTTAATFANGTTVQLRAAAALLTDIQQNIAAKSANQTVYNATTASSATSYDVGTNPQNENNAMVFLDGVMQHHDTFSFSGSTLTFDAAPSNGLKLEVIIDNLINLQSSNLTVDTFTATNGQTAFTLSDTPAAEDNLIVFIEGVFQNQDSYSISNNVLTMSAGVTTGRKVVVYVINPVNIGTPSDGTVTSAKLSGNITMPGTLTVGSNDVAFDSPTFVVDNANSRVGLGTASPSVPVDIVGDVKMSSTLDLTSHLDMPDNAKIKLGTGDDLEIYHDGSHNYIDAVTGDQDIIFKGTDSSSDITALTLDMSDLGSAKFNGPNLNITADDARLLVEEADGTNIGWFGDITGAGVGGCFLYNHGGTATVQIRADANVSFINNGSNFGIGTSAPEEPLHVSEGDSGVTPKSGTLAFFENDGAAKISIGSANDNDGQILFGDDGDNDIGAITYSHGGDRMEFKVNGSERMRIDSSGKLGIGTTSPDTELHVAASNSSAGTLYTAVGSGNVPSITIQNSSTTDDVNAAVFFKDNSGMRASIGARFVSHASGDQKAQLRFSVTGSGTTREKMVLTEDGNLSLGAETASHKIEAHSGGIGSKYDSNNHVTIRSVSGGQYIQFSDQGALGFMQITTYPNSGAAEIARLQSNGFTIGNAAIAGHADQMLRVAGSKNGYAMLLNNTNSTVDQPQGLLIDTSAVSSDNNSQVFLKCDDSSAARMQVFTDGDVWTSDAGTLSSDETLKTDIVDASSKLSDVMNLRVRNFKWKTDYHPVKQHKHIGFIAQELETVFPSLVVENNIARDDEEPNMKKGIKQGGLIPILVKSIQELKTELDAAKARIKTLEDA